MKAIVVEKKDTQKEIDRILKEKETNTIKFVCINADEVNNNGFQDLIKDVNFETHNVIVI